MINYRCISPICDLSNKLFPDLPKTTSGNTQEIESSGITFVRSSDVQNYIERHNPSPMQLRWDKRTKVSREYYAMNFGESKGLTFERVSIYPPKNFIEWILDNNLEKIPHTSRSKYYVALTRAKFSVGLVFDYPEDISVDGILLYKPN